MNLFRATAVAALLTAGCPANAEPMVGAGTNKCEDLNFFYAQPAAKELMPMMLQQWTAGFFTAMNLAAGGLKRKMRDIPTDPSTIEPKIKAFCEKNPSGLPAEVALDIYKELPLMR